MLLLAWARELHEGASMFAQQPEAYHLQRTVSSITLQLMLLGCHDAQPYTRTLILSDPTFNVVSCTQVTQHCGYSLWYKYRCACAFACAADSLLVFEEAVTLKPGFYIA